MAERLTPGVYIEEVGGSVKPIQGVATSTAGFVGEAARGIPDRATFVSGFREYEHQFGGHRRGEPGFLAQAIQAFFDAGGRRAFVVRVLPANAAAGTSAPAPAHAADAWGLTRNVLRFDARGNGAWSNHLRIHVEPASSFPDSAFRLRVEWTEGGRSRTVETFDNLRMDPEHPDYAADIVNDTSRYITVTDLFQGDFIDAAPRTLPPLPERVPALNTAALANGTFAVPEGAALQLRWRDAASGAGIPAETPATVTFDNAAVVAVGGILTGGTATLTAAQMRDLLANALGARLRVSIPAAPATLTSEEGPFDTSGGAQSVVAIDGVNRNLVFQRSGAATMILGPGPFAVDPGDQIALTVDGTLQTYTLVAADLASAGAATPAELAAALNREMTGVQAFVEPGGDLVLRTDRLGPAASLTLAGSAAGGLGNPGAAQGVGNVADPATVTAEELAAIFNAIPANPFQARASAGRAVFGQIDISTPARIRWISDPGPDTLVQDLTEQAGPATPDDPFVRVEPAVASRAYLTARPAGGAADFNLAAAGTVTLTATGDGPAQSFVLNVATTPTLSPAALAAALQAGVDTAPDNPFRVAIESGGDYLVAIAGPMAGGVRLSIAAAAGAPPWETPRTRPGAGGTLVDSLAGVEITVSEPFRLGVPRVLSGTPPLFTAVRGSGLAENAPANPDLRPAETDDTPIRLLGGDDGSGDVTASQYAGSVTSAGRTGLRAFDTVDLGLMVLPGRTDPGFLATAMGYCDRNDCFLVADGIGSVDRRFQTSASDVRQSVEGLPVRSNNAAMFYPWIHVPDPVGVGRNPRRFVPPSGHVAGIFARTDATRGVWKAPAGIEAVVSGAVGLQHDLVDADQDLLNPIGLNCLRRFPDAGIVSWGSRTLASDPEWRYVPVRRTALFLKKSLRLGLKWAVFEPNDRELWDRIRINITAFMLGLFRQGAFQGASPDEAFRVKCDRETNPQELVDQGVVTAQVAFAPLKPAEFVVIEISQKALIS